MKLITEIPTDQTLDRSLAYSLTSKGMRVVTSNIKNLIDGKRFKSNSINHDLKLVNVRNKFLSLATVKGYTTENQLQTYSSFNTEDDFSILRDMRVDAVIDIQDHGKPRLSLPIELEISVKSVSEYQKKIREIYYHKTIKYLFYVCNNKESERKIKKLELDFAKERTKKIFYITYDDFLSSKESVTFNNQDNQFFQLT